MNINVNSNMFRNGFKAKRQKFGVGSLVLLLLMGAVFVGAGYFALSSFKIDPNWQRVSGEVVDSSSRISDGSTTYTAVVKYTVNGQEYRRTTSTGSSSYPDIGKKFEVAYNPDRPAESKVVEGMGETWWLWIFPVIGAVIIIYAPVAFVKSHKRSSNINNLLQTGHKLQGVLVDIQSMGSANMSNSNNNNGYKIVVSATDPSGAVQNYVSDSVGGIGGLAMADFRNSPIPIDVYIDPTNPQNYYVDISDIPNLTPQRITELVQSAAKSTQPQSIMNARQAPQPVDNIQPPLPPKI